MDNLDTSLPSAASGNLNSASSELWVLNQQARNPNRPSLKYSSGGSGPLWKKNEAFCLPTTGGSGQYVAAIPKLNQGVRALGADRLHPAVS